MVTPQRNLTNVRTSAPIADGCELVITKRGAAGAAATDGHAEYSVASAVTSVIDTVGAGDAFAAGIIVGMFEGSDMDTNLSLASALAARVVSACGDVDRLPRRRDLDLFCERMSSILETIRQYGVVAIVRAADTREALQTIRVLVRSGLRVLEVSLVTPNALDLIRMVATEVPGGVHIGVGDRPDA